MPKQHHRKFITTPVIVVVFLFFGTGCLLLSILLHTESSPRLPSTTITTTTTQTPPSSSGKRKKNIVILLQQSPVNGKEQIQRLQTIDDGWATWTMLSTSQMAVYAAIDNDNTPTKHNETFRNIHLIRHQRYTANRSITENDDRPLENMIHSMATLALFHSSLEWLVFANDHTFFIPSNLQCFLSTWDANFPLYSGNKLIRGTHRSFPLYFASGGSGVIVSRSALKMFLLALVIGHDQYINTFMNLHIKDGTLTPFLTTRTKTERSSDNIDNDHAHRSFVKAMISLYEWQFLGKSLPSVLKVVLSPHHVIILRDPTLSSHLSTTSTTDSPTIPPNPLSQLNPPLNSNTKEIQWIWSDHTNTNTNNVHQESSSSYTMSQLSSCVPQTIWERSNPGLVLAYCLQAVFNVPFPTTNESNVISPVGGERFNVYGLLRTLRGDTDPWYTECKLALHPGSLKGPAASAPFLFPVAKDVISWHYVSEHESLLLYQILSSRYPELSMSPHPNNTTKISNTMSSKELFQRWPHTNKDVGPYSVKMTDQQEASRVVTFLYQHVTIRSMKDCRSH